MWKNLTCSINYGHLVVIYKPAQTSLPCWILPPGLQNPIDAMYHLQPLMFLGLFPLFLYNEGEFGATPFLILLRLFCFTILRVSVVCSVREFWRLHPLWCVVSLLLPGLSLSTSDKLFRVTELSPFLYSLITLSIGGSLAFGLGFSEFLLVSRTSSLTLSIAGIFKVPIMSLWHCCIICYRSDHIKSLLSIKPLSLTIFSSSIILQEVCTLLLAAALMGDRMSMLNWLGFIVCLCGISLHVGLKTYYSKSKSLC